MPDGVSGFIPGNSGVAGLAETIVASESIGSGMYRVAIVGVNDMTSGAAAGSVIAGLIVGPEE
jgi:hypothetical protein